MHLRGTGVTCIDKTSKYEPTKYCTPVHVRASAQAGVKLEIHKELPAGPIESFDQLLASQQDE